MKKYSNSDIKSLKRTEIIELLKKEGVEFDESMPFFSLRKLLLEVEDGVVEEPKAEEEPIKVEEQPKVEEPIKVEEPKVEPKKAEPKKEVEQPKQNSPAARKSFNAELAKRMAAFGKVHKNSPFELELARRKGKPQGAASFADELKARQIKARRF